MDMATLRVPAASGEHHFMAILRDDRISKYEFERLTLLKGVSLLRLSTISA
jgi:hypothetical protein